MTDRADTPDASSKHPWVARKRPLQNAWIVEPKGGNGGFIVAEFYGPDAEANARFVAGTRAAPDLAAENARLRAAIEPSDENVERLAEIICNAAWADDGEDWTVAGDEQRVEFRKSARAILTAINERVEPKP